MDNKTNLKFVKMELLSAIRGTLIGTLIIAGCVALFLFGALPLIDDIFILGILLTIVIWIVALIGMVIIGTHLFILHQEDIPQELRIAKFFTVLAIVFIIVIGIATPIVTYIIYDYNHQYIGYRSGNYSQYTCQDCGYPADGGCFVIKGAESGYYCKTHYDERKTATNNTGRDDYSHDEMDVYIEAKNIVKDKLKSPSTASFGSKSETTISKQKNTWTISGWVDAQNSFGATIRSQYTVKITFTSRTAYTIDRCIIE